MNMIKTTAFTKLYDSNSNAGLKIFEYRYENDLKTTAKLNK